MANRVTCDSGHRVLNVQGGKHMDQFCWEIIQCGNKESCPAQSEKQKPCWEVIEEHNSFQCQYGLCEECIVYLGKSNNSIFSRKEFEEVLMQRKAHHQVC